MSMAQHQQLSINILGQLSQTQLLPERAHLNAKRFEFSQCPVTFFQ
jgi:predicted HD phosphohydrolase